MKRTGAIFPFLVIVTTIGFLLPFVSKPFHIDDPLFVWAAQQIQGDPVDFYGFNINWYLWEKPMSEVMQNPPLTSYYIALVAAMFGWSETVFHLAFLLPAIAVTLGVYYLAMQLRGDAPLSVLTALVSPVFLISATNVMSDVMALAFWVWSVFFWLRAADTQRLGHYGFASLLIILCSFTKYYGIFLIPLLTVYSLFRERRVGPWIWFIVFPTIVLLGFQTWTQHKYGTGLLFNAAWYSAAGRNYGSFFSNWLPAISFMGGCILPFLFYAHRLWPRRLLLLLLATGIGVSSFLLAQDKPGDALDLTSPLSFALHALFFAFTGLSVLAAAALELRKNRDADSLLLFCWIFGFFVFAASLNWTVNGRSLLPMLPAAAILLSRRLAETRMEKGCSNIRLFAPLVPAAAIALWAAYADFTHAHSARKAARDIAQRYENEQKLWFQGHWGFQYYMQQSRARSIDFSKDVILPRDIVASPRFNCNVINFGQSANKRETLEYETCPGLAVNNIARRAGFYALESGPLPFAFGRVPSEKYDIEEIKYRMKFNGTYVPECAEEHVATGIALMRQNKTADAIKRFRSALAIDPEYAEAHQQLGVALCQSADINNGISHLLTALKEGLENADLHFNLGKAFKAKDATEEAIHHFRQTVNVRPDYVAAHYFLSWILATDHEDTLRNGPEALELAKHAAEMTERKNPKVLDALAAAYAELSLFDEAIELIKEAIDLATDDTSLLEELEERLDLYQADMPFRSR